MGVVGEVLLGINPLLIVVSAARLACFAASLASCGTTQHDREWAMWGVGSHLFFFECEHSSVRPYTTQRRLNVVSVYRPYIWVYSSDGLRYQNTYGLLHQSATWSDLAPRELS